MTDELTETTGAEISRHGGYPKLGNSPPTKPRQFQIGPVETILAGGTRTYKADAEPEYWLVRCLPRIDSYGLSRIEAYLEPGAFGTAIPFYVSGTLKIPGRGLHLTLQNVGTNDARLQVTPISGFNLDLPAGFDSPFLYNAADSTFERMHNNFDLGAILNVIASAADKQSARRTNYNARGVSLILDVTANPGGADTLQLSIYQYSSVGNDALLATYPAAAAANASYTYQLYPGVVDTLALAKVDVQGLALPRQWYVKVHPTAGLWTYTVTGTYIL